MANSSNMRPNISLYAVFDDSLGVYTKLANVFPKPTTNDQTNCATEKNKEKILTAKTPIMYRKYKRPSTRAKINSKKPMIISIKPWNNDPINSPIQTMASHMTPNKPRKKSPIMFNVSDWAL